MKRNKDLVSVIVPVYNVQTYLGEAIESVIYQTYKNLEIILVDDGSTDGSGKLCDFYAKRDSRIKVIHQNNRGLSAARNSGIGICSGEYIAFLDSDDAFCKDYLKIMMESMQMHEADIVECNYAIYKNTHRMNEKRINLHKNFFNSHLKRFGIYTKREALNKHCNGEIANNVWNKVYKKCVWYDLRFSEGINFEDLDIVLLVLERAKKVCLIDESLIMHRQRKGSITQSFSYTNLSDRDIATKHYYEYIVEHTPMYFDEGVQIACLKEWMRYLLSRYFRYALLRIPEKEKCMNYLRNQIDDVKSRLGTYFCEDITVRVAYFFYRRMPLCLSTAAYCFFRVVKRIIKTLYR